MSWIAPSAAIVAALTLLLLGAGSQATLRLCVRLYPRDHPRREELLAEAVHVRRVVDLPSHWLYLGNLVVAAIVDGRTARSNQRDWRRTLGVSEADMPQVTSGVDEERRNRILDLGMIAVALDGAQFPSSILRELHNDRALLDGLCSAFIPGAAERLRDAVEAEGAQGVLFEV